MRKRTAKLFVMLAILSSFGALSGVAQAKHGADDVNNDISQVDGPGHH